MSNGKVDVVGGVASVPDLNAELALKADAASQGALAGKDQIATEDILLEAKEDLRDRTTHTGVQPIASVDGLQGELDSARKTHNVPRIGTYTELDVSSDGEIARAVSTGSGLLVGGVEEVTVSGQVTGRATRQIALRRSLSSHTMLTGGPDSATFISADLAVGAGTVNRKGLTHPIKWRTTAIGTGDTMHLVLGIGQSLKQGYTDTGLSERIAYWRDLPHDRAWQFKAGDGIQRGPRPFQLQPNYVNRNTEIAATQLETLEPLRGANHATAEKYGQTDMETLALSLLGSHLDHRDHVIAAIVGTGSTAIADFESGSEHYDSAVAIIDAAAAQAEARELALKVWLVWSQGEQDNTDGTLQAAYQASWIGIRDGLSTHTTTTENAAVTEGATFGGAIIQQTEHRPSGATGMATLAHAELIRSGEAIGVSPYAMMPGHSGGAHLFPETYLPLGSACGYAIAQSIADGVPYVSPHVADGDATLVDGTTIDCVFTGDNGTMQFDSATFVPDASHGVRVNDDGGVVGIASVAFTTATTLRITLTGAVVIGDNPVVSFGLYGGSDLSASDKARISIRDTSNWPCPATGQIISGWVNMHTVAATV